MIKVYNLFPVYFYYLAPLLFLFILIIIIGYLKLKIKKIKILPKDYLKFYHYEKKIKDYLKISKFYRFIIEFIINLTIKILQRFKTEALKIQVWTEKHLINLKNIKEQKTDQEKNNFTDDKIS